MNLPRHETEDAMAVFTHFFSRDCDQHANEGETYFVT